jgi:hypothetical protein
MPLTHRMTPAPNRSAVVPRFALSGPAWSNRRGTFVHSFSMAGRATTVAARGHLLKGRRYWRPMGSPTEALRVDRLAQRCAG